MKTFLIRGVPNSVQMDGWWMSEPPRENTPKTGTTDQPFFPRIIALLALVVAGDALTWQAEPGLSLALFGMLVLLALWFLNGCKGWGGLMVYTLLALPLIELAQALSLAFFGLGLVLGASWIALGGWQGVSRWLTAALRFVLSAPGSVLSEITETAHRATSHRPETSLTSLYKSWLLPLGFGLVFASLLLSANPMMESWFASLSPANWISPEAVSRLLFWCGLAIVTLPFLTAPQMQERLKLGVSGPRLPAAPAMLNAGSVCRSLILFNALFAVQTLTDIAYLWGGVALPDGMTYATYAHRGAYPLLATALLAGVFALLARPFTEGSQGLRIALLAWVAQNVFLVLSSLLRLELYVAQYGLTHLRMAAAIWMIVVALGLALVIYQTLRNKPAGWLLGRAALLGLAALYIASLISFSATIARHNLGKEVVLDPVYVCALGPHALPAIIAFEKARGHRLCYSYKPEAHEITDWREWGFRDFRLQASLATLSKSEEATTWPTY
ncbi:DUF4153 domain-containing protein [Lentibacter sp. XHP0401]|uniref:DUF4153 domain-containing protein n=1 Tax=Lentibacter sp. XHP0401 TaxID=2984334 RepID=UPI0021E8AD50|nr:DUF4173 domain-containing protein [Lentibacter sp. XHP0401]MCV2894814.1 DUF4173 domain-containing protein [Lentibacter sp. XHP0401]